MNLRGKFSHLQEKCVKANFIVVEENSFIDANSLGKETATILNMLRVGEDVMYVDTLYSQDRYANLVKKYKACFSGLRKLKDFQLKLHVD